MCLVPACGWAQLRGEHGCFVFHSCHLGTVSPMAVVAALPVPSGLLFSCKAWAERARCTDIDAHTLCLREGTQDGTCEPNR